MDNLTEVIQHAIDAAAESVHRDYPQAEFTVMVVAVPISRALLADPNPALREQLRRVMIQEVTKSLDKIEWPFSG